MRGHPPLGVERFKTGGAGTLMATADGGDLDELRRPIAFAAALYREASVPSEAGAAAPLLVHRRGRCGPVPPALASCIERIQSGPRRSVRATGQSGQSIGVGVRVSGGNATRHAPRWARPVRTGCARRAGFARSKHRRQPRGRLLRRPVAMPFNAPAASRPLHLVGRSGQWRPLRRQLRLQQLESSEQRADRSW